MRRPIRTAAFHGHTTLSRAEQVGGDTSYETWIKACAVRRGVPVGFIKPPDDVDRRAEPAVARVYEGDWIADCPEGRGRCVGAVIVNPEWPVFMCPNCANVGIDGRWRPLVVPGRKQREQIEHELEKRAFDVHRHWFPGPTAAYPEWPRETADDLKRENRRAGLDHEDEPEVHDPALDELGMLGSAETFEALRRILPRDKAKRLGLT